MCSWQLNTCLHGDCMFKRSHGCNPFAYVTACGSCCRHLLSLRSGDGGAAVQELMQANQAQQEALRMVTAAVSEGAKGKDMLLTDLARNPLVAVHLLGSETQHNALLEENSQLRAELDDLKRKSRRDSEKVRRAVAEEMSSGTATVLHDIGSGSCIMPPKPSIQSSGAFCLVCLHTQPADTG